MIEYNWPLVYNVSAHISQMYVNGSECALTIGTRLVFYDYIQRLPIIKQTG
jgi:hypothetical protein